MSTGQAAGGIVGAVAGFLLAPATAGASLTWALYGAQIGATVGGMLFPPKGPSQHGPRLTDLTVQTSTYGANIPRLYGTLAGTGNLIWLEGDRLKERKKKKKAGGKGGGGGTVTTYSYFATFAVGLCVGPIVGIKRLWIGTDLVYDSTDATTSGVFQSGKSKAYWKLYTGTDTQQPDPRYQADKGANSVSGFPGLTYIVFYDLPLAKYSNSLSVAQIKAEVVTSGSAGWQKLAQYNYPSGGYAEWNVCSYFAPNGNSYYFEPLWDGSYSQTPYMLNVWRVGPDFSRTLERVVNTGIVTNPNSVTPLFGKLDIPAVAIGWPVPGDSRVLIIDRNQATKLFNLPSLFDFASGLGLHKRGDAAFVWATATIRAVIRIDYQTGLVAATSSTLSDDIYDVDSYDDTLYVVHHNGSVSVLDALTLEFGSLIPPPAGYASTYVKIASTGVNTFLLVRHGQLYRYADGAWSAISSATPPLVYNALCNAFPVGDDSVVVWTASIGAYPNGFQVFSNNLGQSNPTLASVVQAECLQSNLLTAGDLDVTALAGDAVRGFRVTETGTIRAGLEPLSMIWPFDVRAHGYQLQFVRRGGSSVVSIPASDLDARNNGDEPGVLLTIPRDMDSELPRRVVLTYLDAEREYDRGEQFAARYNTDACNISELSVAIALTAQEAKRAAEVLLYNYWRERGADISFKLPPTWLQLEPADVVTVTAEDGGSHVLRLVNTNTLPSGVAECTARRDQPGGYVSTAVTDGGLSNGVGLIVYGPSVGVLMDLPLLLDADDRPGFYAGMCGVLETWQSGTLLESPDNGQTWDALLGFDEPCTLGTVPVPLGLPMTTHMVDNSGALTVTPYMGDLASVTLEQMLGGANHFAYGIDGRWEIIAAQTVTLNGDGSYTLRDFLRGRLGTEQYAGVHESGDLLVLLETLAVEQITTTSSVIGLERLYRSITSGADLDTDTDTAFTYRGVNLKPLSPVDLNGNRHPSTHDWQLTWVRRTRVGAAWRDNVDASIGETSEAYEVEIYTDSTYLTVLRTLTGVITPTVTYTSTQQVADFGGNQSTLYVKVYQLSTVVGRGYPLIATITR